MDTFSNSILDGEYLQRTDETGTVIASMRDYLSLQLPEIKEMIENCNSDWFRYAKVDYNDTLQRLAYDIYGNASYWDVIMIINNKSPFNCLPFDDDTIKLMAENKANNYRDEVYGNTLDNESYDRLYAKYLAELVADNDDRYIIKIIKPIFIQEFLQLGYSKGLF